MKTIQRESSIYQAVIRASAGLVVAAIALQLPASAAEECVSSNNSAIKSADVSVADLDLSTASGIREAKERLHRAARKLCNEVLEPNSISHQPDFVRCVDTAMAAATAKLERPLLARSEAVKGAINR